jgi:hypothetical protein
MRRALAIMTHICKCAQPTTQREHDFLFVRHAAESDACAFDIDIRERFVNVGFGLNVFSDG